MTIPLTPEDERLIQERLRRGSSSQRAEAIHHALVSSPLPALRPDSKKARQNLADVLSRAPFAGSELNLDRIGDYPRPLDR